MKKLTLDTGVLIQIIDDKPGAKEAKKLLEWHRDSEVEIYVSNRVFEHDTSKMRVAQVEKLRDLLEEFYINIQGASFRLNFSLLSGGDLLDGGLCQRTWEEMARFTVLVGMDPAEEYRASKTLSNKLGDYDSLLDHFASRRDVFITLDGKHYLDVNRRQRYAEQLGLIIQSPTEFLAQNAELRLRQQK